MAIDVASPFRHSRAGFLASAERSEERAGGQCERRRVRPTEMSRARCSNVKVTVADGSVSVSGRQSVDVRPSFVIRESFGLPPPTTKNNTMKIAGAALALHATCLVFVLTTTTTIVAAQGAAASQHQPYFIQRCYKADPAVNECLKNSGNVLVEYFRRGIPELGVAEVEPIIIDEIGISLGSGPDGYRASFQHIEAYGVSNMTVTAVRSDLDTYQFQLTFFIPKITAKAKYRSSGVLILVKASGAGDYWGEYEGVKVKIYFKALPHKINGQTYMSVDQMKMDFTVRDIKMGVENVHDGNTVLQAALNLFINTNAQELLKEMKPDLKNKLIDIMKNFMENLFANIPYEAWIV